LGFCEANLLLRGLTQFWGEKHNGGSWKLVWYCKIWSFSLSVTKILTTTITSLEGWCIA
jgi:hypothetical protein